MMEDFFKVKSPAEVVALRREIARVGTETVPLPEAWGRVLAETVVPVEDLPPFARSTMDGFAVQAASTFGASEGNPAYLEVVGSVAMGEIPDFAVGNGQAARISTGGMLPRGADAVVMIEHTAAVDDTMLEVYRSVAPGGHVIRAGEDYARGQEALPAGIRLRAQETGLLAALGQEAVKVYRRPVVGIISTGDEVVPISRRPDPGQIRDVNSYSLAAMVQGCGGRPKTYGIVADNFDALRRTLARAADECDMLLISGGSSVGVRDFTIEALSSLPDCRILVHGISISPGKPTILAMAAGKALWGLPGHITSAMVVFQVIVQPFIEQAAGLARPAAVRRLPARLTRNIASAQGRVDYVRVRLTQKDGELQAEPLLGKSGLINTLVRADGLVEIDVNAEGLDRGSLVMVRPV